MSIMQDIEVASTVCRLSEQLVQYQLKAKGATKVEASIYASHIARLESAIAQLTGTTKGTAAR